MEKKKKAEKGIKQNRWVYFLANIAKLLLEFAKLTYAGLVIGILLDGNMSPSTLMDIGVKVTVAGCAVGIAILTFLNKE